jgi:hypothetical protein
LFGSSPFAGSFKSASFIVKESTGRLLAISDTGTARELVSAAGLHCAANRHAGNKSADSSLSVPTQIAAVATMSSHEGMRRASGIYNEPGRLKKTLYVEGPAAVFKSSCSPSSAASGMS